MILELVWLIHGVRAHVREEELFNIAVELSSQLDVCWINEYLKLVKHSPGGLADHNELIASSKFNHSFA